MRGRLLVVLAWLALAGAHICAIAPAQRGPLSVHTAGDDTCYRRLPDCGGMPAQSPTVTYTAGSSVSLLFQQNLNHWSAWSPGYLDVSIAMSPTSTDWQLLGI